MTWGNILRQEIECLVFVLLFITPIMSSSTAHCPCHFNYRSGCGNFHISVIDHSMLMESIQRKIESLLILQYMSIQAEVVVCV